MDLLVASKSIVIPINPNINSTGIIIFLPNIEASYFNNIPFLSTKPS